MNRKLLAITPYGVLLIAMIYIRASHTGGKFTLEDLFLALALCAATVGPTLIADSITRELVFAQPLWRERQELTVQLKQVRKKKSWAHATYTARQKALAHDQARRNQLGALYDRAQASQES